jgi:hypothetical protein
MQALEKLEIDEQHVATDTLRHVRKTDDFKEYKMPGVAAVHMSTAAMLLCIFSIFEFHHAQYNTQLGVPTSCAETRRSLGC